MILASEFQLEVLANVLVVGAVLWILFYVGAFLYYGCKESKGFRIALAAIVTIIAIAAAAALFGSIS